MSANSKYHLLCYIVLLRCCVVLCFYCIVRVVMVTKNRRVKIWSQSLGKQTGNTTLVHLSDDNLSMLHTIYVKFCSLTVDYNSNRYNQSRGCGSLGVVKFS